MQLPLTVESYHFTEIIQEGIAHSSDGISQRRQPVYVHVYVSCVRVYVCFVCPSVCPCICDRVFE